MCEGGSVDLPSLVEFSCDVQSFSQTNLLPIASTQVEVFLTMRFDKIGIAAIWGYFVLWDAHALSDESAQVAYCTLWLQIICKRFDRPLSELAFWCV